MPVERRVRILLSLANRMAKRSDSDSILVARSGGVASSGLLGRLVLGQGAPVASIHDHLVPVMGGEIAVRVYRPFGRGPFPLHVFMHGGGFATGSVAERDPRCRDLAADVGCVVASIDYRLAPDHKFPTAPEDCYAVLGWLVEHAEELDVRSDLVAVGGESAGATLAAVLCLMARHRCGPRIVFQLLDVPATDLTLQQPSTYQLATGYLLTRRDMERYIGWYLADPADVTNPYASPLHAEDLTGLPPAVVTTCEYDPLRDEGEAYANRLHDAGVAVVHRRLAGHIHASFALPRLVPSARAHHDYCVRSLREAFAER